MIDFSRFCYLGFRNQFRKENSNDGWIHKSSQNWGFKQSEKKNRWEKNVFPLLDLNPIDKIRKQILGETRSKQKLKTKRNEQTRNGRHTTCAVSNEKYTENWTKFKFAYISVRKAIKAVRETHEIIKKQTILWSAKRHSWNSE